MHSYSLLARHEVAQKDTWDLTPLFHNEEAWEEAFQELVGDYKFITSFRGKLGSSVEKLFKVLQCEEKLQRSIEPLHQYASLRLTEDSSNPASLERDAKLQSLLTQVAEASCFIAPEIQAIEDGLFENYLENPILEPWKIGLLRLRRLKPYTLNDREERLMALSAPAIEGHQETFSQLTNVDMIFGTLCDEEGKAEPLTQSSFSSFLERPDRTLRQKAFEQFYAEFSAHRYTLASSLANSIKGDVFHAKARNYPSALEASLFEDNVPVTVYDNLISSVRSQRDLLYRYYQLRRRVFGLSDLHIYDTYAPLVPNIHSKVSFEEATEKVLASLHPLGSEYISVLQRGLSQERWCDRYENKGKRSGAFSAGTYDSPPYILMNYQEDVFSDIYTLAHEAGHSMHTWFSRRAQNFQNYHYPIFLAEVASTFNEILLTEHLLATTEDRKMRAYIINRQIDDLRSTLFRQTMFAEFEKTTHAAQEAGEALTLDFFRKTYRSLLQDYFGPGVILEEVLDLECLRIPHFYSAFYVYKYATGIAAAVTLATEVLKTGNANRYLDFLKSGNSHFPIETLRLAGVEMNSPDPVKITLQLFQSRLEELEDLLIKDSQP
ncbi:MAG: oligoendopeptidase F [Chthoniobacterales bacterium]|nr:oligoendopeptidase F [Chthoniobacterales bacterium]